MAISYNIPSAPAGSYRISVNSQTYFVEFRWSVRSSCWYFDMSTTDGINLAKNAKLVPRVRLLRSNLHLFPTGNFYVISDYAVKDQIPGRFNIGPNKEFNLVYLTNEEIANAS